MPSIKENLESIESRIAQACRRAGRDRSEVTLVAVSKTKPAEMVLEAYDCGIRDFGENKPQEIRDKFPVLPSDIRWHMIGNLQKNKIKYVAGTACCIHSVDSLELAQAIDREMEKLSAGNAGIAVSMESAENAAHASQAGNHIMPVLIEVNVAEEESKSGVSVRDAENLIRAVSNLPHIRVEGLMTIAPYTENPEENRPYFRSLRKLYVDIAAKNIDNVYMRNLSMGMTGDFEVAIEEGATLIRVGTGIFGAR